VPTPRIDAHYRQSLIIDEETKHKTRLVADQYGGEIQQTLRLALKLGLDAILSGAAGEKPFGDNPRKRRRTPRRPVRVLHVREPALRSHLVELLGDVLGQLGPDQREQLAAQLRAQQSANTETQKQGNKERQEGSEAPQETTPRTT
jgi:hypothetical protein